MDPMDLATRRESYETSGFDLADAADDPTTQFRRWYADATDAGVVEPNAMAVATIDEEGQPEARFVLLKAVDEDGFVFYTNYTSAKGRALDRSGRAGLTFAWLQLRRQVRVRGTVTRTSAAEADAYFATRGRGSQIGAWASPQSDVVPDRAFLDDAYTRTEERFAGRDIPRPDHWGGFRVLPETVEFWQGRPNRFHDRLRYVRSDGGWRIERLAP
jgi:pyridoxamine 5'-phosphate oxidase